MRIISNTHIEKTKNEIKKALAENQNLVIVQAQDDIYNRKLLEYGKFHILLSPESGKRRDSIRQLDSGFNNVLGKIATKNKIAMGINLESLSTLNETEKPRSLARIKQNINICKKTKTKIAVVGNQKEGFHFLLSLGASTSQFLKTTAF